MALMTTDTRYTKVAIALHWAIAALILCNLALGFFMEGFEQPLRGFVIQTHISSGITVLLLSIVRIVWRLTHRPPPFAPGTRGWEKGLAHLVHFLLYVAMVLMPLSGWALISANPPPPPPGQIEAAPAPVPGGAAPAAAAPKARRGGPTKLWWVIPWPKIGPIQRMGTTPQGIAEQKLLHDTLVERHMQIAWIIIALLVLHVGGALKHQFVDGQAEFARMGIGRGRRAPR
ncbi:cytochrome b [Sphingomonas naphthae]|uniref:Cytochrome b n=1 Tax=Sphingomonas naphthae TaxID=1813468 RepID=A0ABY7TPF1_9SPHN|nr:cytochrome b [Sphingomonas naphthae]WCT75109.1 cytochrome b [Sphingomonas naphthae]